MHRNAIVKQAATENSNITTITTATKTIASDASVNIKETIMFSFVCNLFENGMENI